ncbi:MAG: sodium:proton antiporter [Hymenobacteraceae bacterium]|nr:sodium:proton antiporter [Hymenobacteraceae bacterium]
MEFFHVFSVILVISAVFAYINHRLLKLPTAISLLLAGLFLSVVVQGLGAISPAFEASVEAKLASIDFSEILLDVMLSFLLFAGAMHTNLDALKQSKWPILIFATVGVLMSTFLTGTIFYYLLQLLHQPIPYIHCLLFGALITPTDPVAVLGLLKKANLPERLEVKITGESLFNDGVGVVIFLTLFGIAQTGFGEVEASEIGILLLEEVGGGIFLGLVLGYIGFKLMKSINHYQTEVLISLAMVMGGYSLASYLHFSGPLAMVIAGLFIGNHATETAMSEMTLDYVTKFWEMVDEILNAALFVLIGLEMMLISLDFFYIEVGLISTVVVVLVRFISLATPSYLLGFRHTFEPDTLPIMTWGGLRGGISIALALSLLPSMSKELIVTATYTVVLFSLAIQGLTMEPFIGWLKRKRVEA